MRGLSALAVLLTTLPARGQPAPPAAPDPQALAAACERGEGIACRALGERYEAGRGVPTDPARAADLYLAACERGDPAGCDRLGVVRESGLGGVQDLEAAERHYRRACDGGAA